MFGINIQKLPDGFWISLGNKYFMIFNKYNLGSKSMILNKDSWGKFYKGFGFNIGKFSFSFLKYSFL